MPGMSGTEVLEALRGLEPGVRVVLSSGYSDDERVASILEKGGRSFLRKPYSMDKGAARRS